MYFRQLRLPDMGCASYMIGSEGTCAVIDPRWDAVSQYIGLARQQNLRISSILETHTHADHVSGATRLAARTGATILLHRAAQVSYVHQAVDEGDEVSIGTVRLKILYTPGHSRDSISVVVHDVTEQEPLRLLSGDTLFVQEVGRPDLHGKQAAELATLLYHSLHEQVLQLADTVEVYPAHLAGSLCGRRIAPAPSTTIGRERETNPMLAIATREEFVRTVVADLPPRPPNVERIVQLNRTIAPLTRPKATHVTAEEAVALLPQVMVVDGRDMHVFAQGHLQGAINVPVSYGQFGVMVGWLLSAEQPLLLVMADEEDLAEAIDSLMVVGMTNPLSVLGDDVPTWQRAGLTVVTTPLIQATALASLLENATVGTLVDVREIGEMEQGTIKGAINLPYRTMSTNYSDDWPTLIEPVVVFCNSGNRSSVAASLLERMGISVLNVVGGTTAWIEAGFLLS